MSDPDRSESRRRRFLFPLITFFLALVPFALLEGILLLFGWADPNSIQDPLIGFTEVRPLFVLNEEGDRYETAKARRVYFNRDSFAAEKSPDEFRIFCLGGSTVAGRPYGIETSFTEWLEIGLSAMDPKREWEVVNCGGVSYASYRLVPILREVLAYEPDLIVLYTGHNEFLEDRTYETIKRLPVMIAKPIEWGSSLRTFTLLRMALGGRESRDPGEPINTLPAEVQARLDYQGGLDKYDHDPDWRRGVFEHFDRNLHRMVRIANEAEVPILLVNPGCNLRDCPPFKSLPKEGLSEERRARFQALVAEAKESYRADPTRSAELLVEATEIDDRNAAAFYELGKCFDKVGRIEEAHSVYTKAKELDICPLRILESMNQSILDLAEEKSLPLVNAKRLVAEGSRDGIPGNDVYIDHVHPTIGSHQRIAAALTERIAEAWNITPPTDWQANRTARYEAHLSSLSDVYFAKGLERLSRLQSWAAGRAESPPVR